MTTIARLRADAIPHGVDPRDVDVLLADALGRSVAWLFAHGEAEVDPAVIEPQLQRRLAGEPLQYIRGRADFYGREFLVDGRVLIPRPETEIVVEQAVARAPRGARVVDVGTGSGCIAISLALERPDLRVFATDVSTAALAVAKHNCDRLGARVEFVACDLLDAIVARLDLIVSNPPYIPAADIETLQTEVRDYEPRSALTPGPRGTEVIERLLRSGVPAIIEIGYGQLEAIREHVDDVIPDLAGIPRVVVSSAHHGGK
ncbi:MAG TPA: peptide chain release factor N(5)-glutamine methyltransferase [Thermoanaerobaculia bacterium]|nr:peptide chain release factor N(5)-glutamine methyltransferase [Thermoanaerobaculia bacterium]